MSRKNNGLYEVCLNRPPVMNGIDIFKFSGNM